MKLRDTRLTYAGVMRCCLASVGLDHPGLDAEVEEGDESSCGYCDVRFRLVGGKWVPLWQIEREQG